MKPSPTPSIRNGQRLDATAELASVGRGLTSVDVDLSVLVDSATTRACPRRALTKTSNDRNLAAGRPVGPENSFFLFVDLARLARLCELLALWAETQVLRGSNTLRFAFHVAVIRPNQSLSISDLARQNGVPERTLRTAFQRCYGFSPVEYLRIHRLHRARQRLRASCPDETTVTEIGFGQGFWDLGRFAGAYRQLFGELPSETLRKSVRVSSGARPN